MIQNSCDQITDLKQYSSKAGACTLKHYGFVMYGLHSKLVCLFVEASVFVHARRR